MEFKNFKEKIQKRFSEMVKDNTQLFEVNVDKDILWDTYLSSFPQGTNPIFRERTEHDCSCCRQFIKSIGRVVTIKNGKLTSIWDVETNSSIYQPVADALSELVKSSPIKDVFVSKESKFGTDFNHEIIDGKTHTWEHFFLKMPSVMIHKGYKSCEEVKGEKRDVRNVFKRSLDEISVDAIETVLELIAQGSLYRGEEWKTQLKKFLEYKKQYENIKQENEKELFAWEKSIEAGVVIGKIRNHSIGVLLTDITNNIELDKAVRSYEQIVAPLNYKRPKPIYSQKQLEMMKEQLEKDGYMESLKRRHATLSDISINNVLFVDRNVSPKLADGNDLFEDMAKDAKKSIKKFDKVEEVGIDKFLKDILPTARGLEVYLENNITKNMVSLIAPENADAKSMFKWDNPFSWAYRGNVADSLIKQNVKNAGGNINAVLRGSLQWNDIERDGNDLDLHCHDANGIHIHYPVKGVRHKNTGMLDIDVINPSPNTPAVENITYTDINKMADGEYLFSVHCFTNRGGKSGFRFEIEFDGQLYNFDYRKPLKQGEFVKVAIVTLKNGVFSIKPLLDSTSSSVDIWGLKTNEFIPVSVVMYCQIKF